MNIIMGHEVQKGAKGEDTLILYLAPQITEFAEELGQDGARSITRLEDVISRYVREKLPQLKLSLIHI